MKNEQNEQKQQDLKNIVFEHSFNKTMGNIAQKK